MRVTIYKSGWPTEAEALEAGFKAQGDEVYMRIAGDPIDEWTQMAVFMGLSQPEIFNAAMRAGKHTLLLDYGYLSPFTHFRLALDGYQSRFVQDWSYGTERLFNILMSRDVQLHPMLHHEESQDLLYVGCNPEYCRWHRLGEAAEYDVGQMAEIIANLKSRGHIQFKPDYMAPNPLHWLPRRTTVHYDQKMTIGQLMQRRGVRILVTHGHRAAVEAMIQGIPVFTLSGPEVMPIYPLCQNGVSRVWIPVLPSEEQRLQVLSNLAHTEFTLEEIANGAALALLTPHCVKRFEGYHGNPNDLGFIFDQYKMMHQHPKRYRGGLEDEWADEIGRLCNKHRPIKRLLDYGAGKGRQYLDFKSHENWKAPMPVCYDPGFEAFKARPEGRFDGVICTDVAEHVPEEQVDWFLHDVLGFATKFVFFVIFTSPAAKTLPDGRNCHLTIRPKEWWLEKLQVLLTGVKPKEYAQFVPMPHKTLPDAWALTDGRRDIIVKFQDKE